jgi:hypothetical protein
VYLVILGAGLKKWVVKSWEIEEAGCQAHEQFSRARELLGIDFLKVINCSYSALRLPVHPVTEALEGKWGSRGTVE